MPTQTFFNLPKEKQQRLLDAAAIEFSRAPLKEASISNIVKLAEIPRGSFYQYFENKEDLYFYYFRYLRKSTRRDLENLIQQENGDLIKAFDQYFQLLIEDILVGEHADFYRNLFMYVDYHASKKVSPEFLEKNGDIQKHLHSKNRNHDAFEKLIENVDMNQLKLVDKKELIMLFHVLMSFVFTSINEGYRQQKENNKVDIETIKAQFSTKLSWIKYGIYKKDGE